MGQLDGKVTILTGAGTGIGKGIARGFAREGSHLILASRNQANLEETAKEIASSGIKVLVVPDRCHRRRRSQSALCAHHAGIWPRRYPDQQLWGL